jgi:hypothetical protein
MNTPEPQELLHFFESIPPLHHLENLGVALMVSKHTKIKLYVATEEKKKGGGEKD